MLPATPVSLSRARTLWLLGFALGAHPALAQSPGARLHREIPGDLGFESLAPSVVAASQSARDLQQAAGGAARWDETQRPGDTVVRPREAWSSPVREMDTDTRSPVGYRLRYEEVFNPSVAPFKRTQAYDGVDDLGRLVVRSPGLRPLSVGADGQAGPTARFTGDLFVELSPGAPTPLPSVAGVQRVVSYRAVPAVRAAFAEDSAGNLVVQADVPQTVRVRLTYVLEAPESAFSAPRIAAVPLADVPRQTGVATPVVPAYLRDSLEPVLRATGVRRTDTLDRAVSRLTDYFRRFRDAQLTERAGDNRYLALALGGVGACRHRAYAFVLTLHALGVPARYVGNEAHAWAEVALPGTGWSRIDLGGWDVGMDATAPSAREHFTPLHPDPLPRPQEYANSYSSYNGGRRDPRATPTVAVGDAGVGPATPEPGNPSPGAPETAASGTATGTGTGTGGGAESVGATGDPQRTAGPGAPTGTGGARGPGGLGGGAAGALGGAVQGAEGPRGVGALSAGVAGAQGPQTGDEPPMGRPRLQLLSVRPLSDEPGARFVRGRPVVCVGEARDAAGMPVASLPVEVELLRNGRPWRVGRGGRADAVLGTTVTREDGRFEAQVLVPLELDAGDYALRLRSPGDMHNRPVVSE